MRLSPKARWFWPLVLGLAVTDCATKDVALSHLDPTPIPHRVVGEYLRFTLARNPKTAFGFDPRPCIGAALLAIALWREDARQRSTDLKPI